MLEGAAARAAADFRIDVAPRRAVSSASMTALSAFAARIRPSRVKRARLSVGAGSSPYFTISADSLFLIARGAGTAEPDPVDRRASRRRET